MSREIALAGAGTSAVEDRRKFEPTIVEIAERAVRFDRIAPADWPWRWFQPVEVACQGTGLVFLYETGFRNLMYLLDAAREADGSPMFITSCCRTPGHNRDIGSTDGSQHPRGTAADIALSGRDPKKLEALLRNYGARGVGRYPKKKFIHVDVREGRPTTWGSWK